MAREWKFDVDTAIVHVHCGTGHWSQILDTAKGVVTGSVYVYEATYHFDDGTSWNTFVTQSELRKLRKDERARAAAAQEGGGDGA